MQEILVDKAELMEKLEHNKADHRALFLKAQEKYRERWIELLDEHLKDAREGRKIKRLVSLPEPEDFTESFDTAIEMLKWEVSDKVSLSQHDFERYVLNKWEWNQRFTANTTSYLAT